MTDAAEKPYSIDCDCSFPSHLPGPECPVQDQHPPASDDRPLVGARRHRPGRFPSKDGSPTPCPEHPGWAWWGHDPTQPHFRRTSDGACVWENDGEWCVYLDDSGGEDHIAPTADAAMTWADENAKPVQTCECGHDVSTHNVPDTSRQFTVYPCDHDGCDCEDFEDVLGGIHAREPRACRNPGCADGRIVMHGNQEVPAGMDYPCPNCEGTNDAGRHSAERGAGGPGSGGVPTHPRGEVSTRCPDCSHAAADHARVSQVIGCSKCGCSNSRAKLNAA